MTQLRELQLMKRTAWMNDRLERCPKMPNEAQEKQELTTAMYMLAYLGAIDMALIDLKDTLQQLGIYRHSLKHTIERVCKVVANANGLANSILKAVNNGQRVRQYADMYEYAYNKVQDNILIENPSHRSYSIVKALSRLFIEAYNKVGIKTNHRYLGDVAKALPRIDISQLKDFNIDCIIRKAVHIEIRRDEQDNI